MTSWLTTASSGNQKQIMLSKLADKSRDGKHNNSNGHQGNKGRQGHEKGRGGRGGRNKEKNDHLKNTSF
jgi:hypothetical protein